MAPSTNVDANCLFCAILQGKIPSMKVYETERSLAFLDIHPVSEGHTLVISKYHARTLTDLPDEYLADIGPVLKKVALATGSDNYNILQNNGKLAFQHVDHVHFHVVPKMEAKDGLVLTIDENWAPRKVEAEQLAATLEKLKSKI